MLSRTRSLLLIVCVAAAGCNSCEPEPYPSSSPLQRPEKPFVVFLEKTLVIERLSAPVRAPVTVGSEPSSSTMFSDSPDVVSIDATGALVAHRNGFAIVRARDTGSALTVHVAEYGSIRAVPKSITVSAGEAASVRIIGPQGADIPPAAVRWASSAPETASAFEGVVRTGRTAGAATLVAQYGQSSTRVRVEVQNPDVPSFLVRPRSPSLRIGELVSFEALGRSGPVDAEWSSSNSRVAARLEGRVFRAMTRGQALVCATASARRACTKVEVHP